MTDNVKLEIELEVSTAGSDLVDLFTKKLAKLEAQIRSITGLAKAAAKSISSPTGKDSASVSTSAPRQDNSAAIVRSIRQEAAARERALKARFAFESRMGRQREREQSDVIAGIEREQRARESALRRQFSFVERMSRQRSREEAQAEREIRREAAETARARDREARRSAQEQRRQDRQTASEALAQGRREAAAQRRSDKDRDQGRDSIVRGAGQVRSGVGRAVAVGGATGAVLSYGSKRAIDSLTRSGMEIDAVMNSNARMESGVSADKSNKRASNIRTKSMPIARSLGIKTAEYIKARAEALQAGVDGDIVDAVTEYGSKYARINDLKANDVMESSGYGLTAMNSYGKVTPEVAKNFFNKMQYLAANTAASRQNLASFSKRGLSAGASLGMSVDDSLAFGGAATASGADGEMASRMLASQGTRLAELKTKAADIARKSHKSVKDREFLSLPRLFGFNNYKDLSASVSADAAGTFEKIYEGIGKIADPVKRMQASELIFGKEFGPITAAMSKGGMFGKMRTAVRSKDANNAIDTGMNIRSGSFDFIMSQISATVQDLKDSLGLVLKPLWADIRDFVMKAPAAFQSFENAFRSGLRGFLQGLGGDGTMAGLLRNWFGDPASFTVNARAIGDFAKGFGQGLRDIGSAITSVIRAFAGSDASAESIGRWSARLIGFCAAALVAAPAIAVLGGLATVITGLATAALGAWNLLKGAGLVGAAGASAAPKAAGIPGLSVGIFALAGKLMGVAFVAEVAKSYGIFKTPDASKGVGRSVLEFLDPGLADRVYGKDEKTDEKKGSDEDQPRTWVDPPNRSIDNLKKSVEENTKVLKEQQNKTIQNLTNRTSSEGTISYAEWMQRNKELGWSEASRQNRTRDTGANAGSEVNKGLRGHIGRLRSGISGSPTDDTASPDQKSGGSRSWRNNNPGNIEFGPFAKSMGATSLDGRFAKFPTYEAGRRAQENLLFESASYKDLTLGQAIKRWAPASENNVPNYIAAMGGDAGKRMSEYSPEQRGKLLDAMQRHEGWRPGSVAGGGSTANGGVVAAAGAQSAAVEAAKSLVGMGSSQAAAALGAKMTPGQWCADFVNGALAKGDVKGVNSSVANSFLGWGQRVLDGVKPGDVVVTNRGGGVGETGGHVGLATGETRMKNGRLQYETVSGNHGNRVGVGWEYEDKTQVRRAPLGDTAPLNQSNTQQTGGVSPAGSSNVSNVSGGGGASIAIHINGQNHSSDEIANKVQRRLQDSMNRRTHDYDGFA